VTDSNARENIAEDTARGDQALAAARHLIAGGFQNDAVSRAYYAAFHWACAVLLTKGVEARTPRGTLQLFHLHFVKDGPLSDNAGVLLSRLETDRELSDYRSGTQFTVEQATAAVDRAQEFVDICRPVVMVYLQLGAGL